MSIVAQIVQFAEESKKDYIVQKIPELEGAVKQITKDLENHVEDVYHKYCRMSDSNKDLLNRAIDCQLMLKDLQEKTDSVKDKQLNLEVVSDNVGKLQLLDIKTNYLVNMVNILKLLSEFDIELADSNYIKCVTIINDLTEMVALIPSDGGSILEIIEDTLSNKRLMLMESMHVLFNNNVELIKGPKDSPVILRLQKHNQEMEQVILALHLMEERVAPLYEMARLLWFNVFTPIVDNEIVLSVKEQSNSISLELLCKSNNKSNYKVVFENLRTVLDVLKKHFTYKVNEEITALEYIGNDLRDNLSELIIKNCLRDTIPTNEEGLKQYKQVQKDTVVLEKSLLEARIFTENTASIINYANNVDVLFINNKCKEYLGIGMDIIKKDLHDIVEVGVPEKEEYFSARGAQAFPRCSISKNVEELLTFCEKLLIKACDSNSSPECAGRLFVTVTNILNNYRTFVPEHHKSYLATLPQQIAVFMNNCHYISHTLRLWEIEYCAKLKRVLDECDFLIPIKLTSSIGTELFNRYVQAQVKQVEDIMEGAELNVGLTIEELPHSTEKCVRQCLRQQELLRTVWHKVLPQEIYNKNVGFVVNRLCNSIVTSVIKFDDISANAAEQLVDVIKLVLTRAPKLFSDPKEILLFVPLWNKLNELSFVLSAGLVDIDDRWANGKGPLALYFEAAELKQLIRALFQNTDRRAQVLNRIS